MDNFQNSFAVEQFFCRFLPKQPPDELLLIDDPYWEEDEPPLRFQNIADNLQHTIEQQIDLGDAPFASWLLARLWYLSEGSVRTALRVDAEGVGLADGGHYVIYALIEDTATRGVATLYIEGMDIFTLMILTGRSAQVQPSEIIDALTHTLQAQPAQVALCRIAIADPEQQGAIHEYGWDGAKFLGIKR